MAVVVIGKDRNFLSDKATCLLKETRLRWEKGHFCTSTILYQALSGKSSIAIFHYTIYT